MKKRALCPLSGVHLTIKPNHPESCDLQPEEFPKRVRLLPSVAKKERWVVAQQVRKQKSAPCRGARCAMS